MNKKPTDTNMSMKEFYLKFSEMAQALQKGSDGHTKRIYCGTNVFEKLYRAKRSKPSLLVGGRHNLVLDFNGVSIILDSRMPPDTIGTDDKVLAKLFEDFSCSYQESITCPKCQRTSYNRNDIQHKYCNQCGYHDD